MTDKRKQSDESSRKATRVQEVVTLLPAHRHTMDFKQALANLRGKGKGHEMCSVLSVIQWMREDALNDSLNPSLAERQAGFFAGRANVLRELEETLQNAFRTE